MSTLSEVVTAVSVRLQDDANTAVSTSIVEDAINESISHWKKKQFWFNEFEASSTSNLVLTSGSPTIPVPSTDVTMLYPFQQGGLVINYSSARYELKPVASEIYDQHNKQGSGLPYVYTFKNNGYEAYYYPDQAYEVIWRGIRDYDALVSTGSDDWTTHGESLIKYDALYRLSDELRLDPEMSDRYTTKRDREHRNLVDFTNQLKSAGYNHVYF